jgi:predicted PhzF superfamily epimerase YddE/YHI9
MALFGAVFVLELAPMLSLIRWRVVLGRGEQPDVGRAGQWARISHVQVALVILLLLAATALARGLGARGLSERSMSMKLKLFQVDAFADRVFEGNPAAVCPLDTWPATALLQAIAEENNLSDTAFFVPEGDGFALRWFTPAHEVDLCGHATLASAHVLFEHLGYTRPEIRFRTRSGELIVTRSDVGLRMDFPAAVPQVCDAPVPLLSGLGESPKEVLAASDYIAVYESEDDIRALRPDFVALQALDRRGVVATAPGREVDFVSRCFFPKLGVDEDPVTGSAHCQLAPYWSHRLGRNELRARQLSKRGGTMVCQVVGERVFLSGRATDYMTAEIRL